MSVTPERLSSPNASTAGHAAAAAKVRAESPTGSRSMSRLDLGDNVLAGPQDSSIPASPASFKNSWKSPLATPHSKSQPLSQSHPRILLRSATSGDLHFKLPHVFGMPPLPALGPEVNFDPGCSVILKTPSRKQRQTTCPGNASTRAKVTCRPWSPECDHDWPPMKEGDGMFPCTSGSMHRYRNGGWSTSPSQSLTQNQPPAGSLSAGATSSKASHHMRMTSFENDRSSRPPNQALGGLAPGHWKRLLHRPRVLIAAEGFQQLRATSTCLQ